MKILYLCLKNTFQNKMSRVRFDGMAAIANKADVIYSGNGWANYDADKTVDHNIRSLYGDDKPDIIVSYKPKNFNGIQDTSIPVCIRYNEMWPVKEWTKELKDNKIDLCIAHHLNDIPKYDHVKDVKFVHIPHSADENIYKDYGEDKIYDVLFTGALGGHYPFRSRLLRIIKTDLNNKLKCRILSHPGNNLKKTNGLIGEDYAREMNKAKMVVTCTSKHFYRLGKYVEIPMSGSMICGDVPGQDEEDFKKFMIVLDPKWSDEKIKNIIIKASNDKDEMEERIKLGLEWSKNYTQEKYAKRFLEVVEDFLLSRES